jgi:hypothetical protein
LVHAAAAVLTLADDADVWALWPPLPHPASATSKTITHMKRDAFRINIPHDV